MKSRFLWTLLTIFLAVSQALPQESLKSNVITGGTTDFNRNLVLTGLPADKKVYIFGYSQTRGGWAIWDVWVDIKGGALQSAVLDQHNASIVY